MGGNRGRPSFRGIGVEEGEISSAPCLIRHEDIGKVLGPTYLGVQ